jgi:hypothetical protein
MGREIGASNLLMDYEIPPEEVKVKLDQGEGAHAARRARTVGVRHGAHGRNETDSDG